MSNEIRVLTYLCKELVKVKVFKSFPLPKTNPNKFFFFAVPQNIKIRNLFLFFLPQFPQHLKKKLLSQFFSLPLALIRLPKLKFPNSSFFSSAFFYLSPKPKTSNQSFSSFLFFLQNLKFSIFFFPSAFGLFLKIRIAN